MVVGTMRVAFTADESEGVALLEEEMGARGVAWLPVTLGKPIVSTQSISDIHWMRREVHRNTTRRTRWGFDNGGGRVLVLEALLIAEGHEEAVERSTLGTLIGRVVEGAID